MPELADPVAYVGLDVSQDEAVVCFLLADGREPVARWAVANSHPGADALVARLAELAQTAAWSPRAADRAGGDQSLLVAPGLRPQERAAPLPFRPRSTASTRSWSRASGSHFGALPKTDRIDALFIAERLRFGRHSRPLPGRRPLRPPPETHSLPLPPRTDPGPREELLPDLPVPELLRLRPGRRPSATPFGATSSAVLEEFTTEELVQTPLEDLARYLDGKGHGTSATRTRWPQHSSARPGTPTDSTRSSMSRSRSSSAPRWRRSGPSRSNSRTRQDHRPRADAPFPQHAHPRCPGLGPVWTAGLVAELGDITPLDNEAAIAKFAGLVWQPHESGEFQAEDTTLAKTGNTYLRYYLVEGANSVRLHCPSTRAYYQAKFAQSPKHAHKRALVLTARKLVRLIDALLRAGALYRPRDASGPDGGAYPNYPPTQRQPTSRRAAGVG